MKQQTGAFLVRGLVFCVAVIYFCGAFYFDPSRHRVIASLSSCRSQTKDDSDPETRQQFTLQITSATGGATIDPSHQVALIEVVASDYPHGLFEFSQPPEVVVREAAQQV